ncbi:RdgB/HAM1 family non-canonical purine NTP pyrophosphatase [Aquitalea sp. LB_tupeE]|uniref:RdgB/HAM1 family non-canonical purine NTP pyrophosphatase n=1 Tax=Aquitalea sp. LB_tupeE TaxID=2748078 RepID=UPI0015BBC977|nr:RdgB/HAM1 family non-canonical purine NTP pyrophosphatase [Aquitalea sp. LB_tupeE]NWK77202.1 RdgB/HAM1 family non-canonical purine NTP pyrophosphatase [Aquitalea sp. LB_tupeE]
MFDKLVLASNNAGKLREFSALLAPLGVTVIPQGQLNVPECPEPHYTFLENALEKARHASHVTGLPALADDSGICVEALGGKPGVLSARYAGEPKSDERNNAKLIEKLQGKDNRRAWYYCVLVLVRHADDPQPLVADGMWLGEVQDTAAGKGGFGYDPYFYLPEFGCTVAQLAAEDKNRVSHRGKAMQAMLGKLRELA